jgi:hypothetical protein
VIIDHLLCTDTASRTAETNCKHHIDYLGKIIGWLRKEVLYCSSVWEYLQNRKIDVLPAKIEGNFLQDLVPQI